MARFDQYITEQLNHIGYKINAVGDKPAAITMEFKHWNPVNERFFVVYLRQAPTDSEQIREVFKFHNAPVLFVVDHSVMAAHLLAFVADGKAPPLWMRALHATYLGRIYTWHSDRRDLQVLHFDWDKKQANYSQTIDIQRVLFKEVDCKLRDFPGQFHVALLGDPAFWMGYKEKPRREPPREQSYEEWLREEFKNYQYQEPPGYRANNRPPPPPEPNIYEEFMRHKREQETRQRERQNYTYGHTPPRPSSRPTGDQWFDQMMAAGSLEGAKQVYRKLGLQYHPDHTKAADATEVMQKINSAYEKVARYLK